MVDQLSPCCNARSAKVYASVTTTIGEQTVWRCGSCDLIYITRDMSRPPAQSLYGYTLTLELGISKDLSRAKLKDVEGRIVAIVDSMDPTMYVLDSKIEDTE